MQRTNELGDRIDALRPLPGVNITFLKVNFGPSLTFLFPLGAGDFLANGNLMIGPGLQGVKLVRKVLASLSDIGLNQLIIVCHLEGILALFCKDGEVRGTVQFQKI